MEYREFLSRQQDLHTFNVDHAPDGLMSLVSHVSPVMKIWLVAMVMNLFVLMVLFS